ncbi:MAG TPA: HD domain-containing phosphohydrolase [Vicinamibacterales bacterium]
MVALGDVLGAARILVVDDEPANVRMLDRLLTNGGCRHVLGITDPRETIAVMPIARPDLIILDLHMPHLDGFEVMQALRPLLASERYLPVLIVTADDTPTVKQRALAMGARDFLAKPFDSVEALLRIRNLLVTRQLYAQLEREQQQLELAVFERTKALANTHLEIVERLARAAEYRDDNTGEHTRRVGRLAGLLARTLGLSAPDAKMIERAAPLHDVGKVGVPDAILLKPAPLSPGEFDIIKTHAAMGARILSGSRVPLLRMAEEIAHSHHERWDGSGYPLGRSGEGIPLSGRIVALADAFDAMTHARPYQKGIRPEAAIEIVRSERGRHFDPQVVDAFLDIADDYLATVETGAFSEAPGEWA